MRMMLKLYITHKLHKEKASQVKSRTNVAVLYISQSYKACHPPFALSISSTSNLLKRVDAILGGRT